MTDVFIVYRDDYQPSTLSVHDTYAGAEAEMLRLARAETTTDYEVDEVNGQRVHKKVPRYPLDLNLRVGDGRLEKYEPRTVGPPWNRVHKDWWFADYWIERHEVKSEESEERK